MEQPNKFLKSSYMLPILWKINEGYRPAQIAEQLRISPQLLNYYTGILIDLKLIEKQGDRSGLTPLGHFILKEKLSRSVNSSQNCNSIPIRLHNLTFSFDILSMDENLSLQWKSINNGVSKCFIKYSNHTLEITKSPIEGKSYLRFTYLKNMYSTRLKG